MPDSPSRFVVRRPRYPAYDWSTLQVRVERSGDQPPPVLLDAQLADLSRHGIRLWMPGPLQMQEQIRIHVTHPSSKIEAILMATVVWVRQEEDRWAIGATFAQEVAWETLGELFLNHCIDPSGDQLPGR